MVGTNHGFVGIFSGEYHISDVSVESVYFWRLRITDHIRYPA
jgi:hypothetical protein